MPRPCCSSSISLSAVVLPEPGVPRSAVTRPARASKERSSTAGGRSLRVLLVSPKAWITRIKIARYVRFSGYRRAHSAARTAPSAPLLRASRAPVSHFGAQHRRVEQSGSAGAEELSGTSALTGGRTPGGHQEAGGAGHLAVEIA